MSSSIYLVVKTTHGPSGHGEPGNQCVSLMSDGLYGTIGSLSPAFTTRQVAELYRQSRDMFGFYRIIELPLLDSTNGLEP